MVMCNLSSDKILTAAKPYNNVDTTSFKVHRIDVRQDFCNESDDNYVKCID